MIWAFQAAVLLLVLVLLLEGMRTAGQLPEAGPWSPVVLLGGLVFFAAYVGWQLSPDCRPKPQTLDDRFDDLDAAGQMVQLEMLRAEVSERLARCHNGTDEAQRWTLYLRLGEMIEALEDGQTHRELERLTKPS